MSLYIIPYKGFVSGTTYASYLILLFIIGVIFMFLVKIEPGTVAELIFFDKATGTYWADGLCLVPTLFPFLHNVGIHFFWWLKKPGVAYSGSAPPYVHHHRDQRQMEYKVNVETTFFKATVARIAGNMFDWFFNIKRGDPELLFQRLGVRIVIVALILGAGSRVASATSEKYDSIFSQFSSLLSTDGSGTEAEEYTKVIVRLEKSKQPLYPPQEFFAPSSKNFEWEIIGGKKYFRYPQVDNTIIPVIEIRESSCVAVPSERWIGIESPAPPRYVVNMVDAVKYKKKLESVSFFEKISLFLRMKIKGDSGPLYWYATWKEIHDNWGDVAWDRSFTSKAMTSSNPKTPGGLVCF
jgi:hypothetical protein